MAGHKYNVVFSGKINDGFDLEEVQLALTQRFKIPPDKALELFKGDPIVVKKDLDEESAAQYGYVLNQIGARTHIEQVPILNVSASQLSLIPMETEDSVSTLNARTTKTNNTIIHNTIASKTTKLKTAKKKTTARAIPKHKVTSRSYTPSSTKTHQFSSTTRTKSVRANRKKTIGLSRQTAGRNSDVNATESKLKKILWPTVMVVSTSVLFSAYVYLNTH